jgi:hypothetical protein
MGTMSRRNALRYLLVAPAIVGLQELLSNFRAQAETTKGYFNLYLEGPFSFVFFSGQRSVVILAPITTQHHEPSFTSEMDEAVIRKSYDYQLVGPIAARQSKWVYPDTATKVDRLLIPATKLGMDQGGTIDKGKNRYFSLRVPLPHTITPWHPVAMIVTGHDSPFSGTSLLPVGYTFTYKNADFSGVKVNCLTDSSKGWNPRLRPLSSQRDAEIIVSMSSLLDCDPGHQVAITSFAAGRDLYKNVNPGKSLDLTLSYPGMPIDCNREGVSPRPESPALDYWMVAHTGADCKAAILEIDGVSDSAVLG